MYRKLILCAGFALATSASAGESTPENIQTVASFAEDNGDVIRVESAEHLRTYSQEVAAAACFLYNDIDAGLSRELLIESRQGFDKRISALRNGSDELGIVGGEQRRKTLVRIDAVEVAWNEMAGAVDALLADTSDTNAVATIKANNMQLLELTSVLATEVEGQYANPSILLQVDALMLDLVGRQAMMTQKIAKDACKIFTGNGSEEIKANLKSSKEIYEATLNALILGMPEVGIKPAPTPEIEAALQAVRVDWATIRPLLDTLVSGGSIERDSQIFLFKHMVQEMARLEDISHKYAEFSKHSY